MALRGDTKTYKNPPKYLKNAEGRIFVATPHLLAREDFEPATAKDLKAVGGIEPSFNLGKATKQQIVDKAEAQFGAELDVTATLKVLREQYKELTDNASDNDS